MTFEKQYQELIDEILTTGARRKTRNAITIATSFKMLSIDSLKYGRFPLVTARKMFPKGVIGEFAAFMHKPTTLQDFVSRGCNYWGKWADEDGAIRVDYGNSWLDWNGINQIQNVIDTLKNNPCDRRMIITGWDPSKLDTLSLPCCHILYQFVIAPDGTLELIWYQRSADAMIGIPSDIILAALLLIYIADAAKIRPGNINMVFGDCHIYDSHEQEARQYAHARTYPLPSYKFDGDLFNFEPYNFLIENYVHGPKMELKLHD